MSTAISNINSASQAIISQSGFTREEAELIRATCAKNTTDAEFAHFLRVAQMRGLNPLANQFHCIVRGQGDNRKATHQVGIDGFRVIADRTDKYAGSDDATFEPGNTEQYPHPASATVVVWKVVSGVRCPFTATARWSEYKAAPGSSGKADAMWRKMPFGQLAKCAEALALRKAFPQDLSGIYEPSEMDQASEPELKQVKTAINYQEWKCSPELIEALITTAQDAKAAGVGKAEMEAILPQGKKTMRELENGEATDYLKRLSDLTQVAMEAKRSEEGGGG